ncbi:glycosyltransferase 87 family protein [Arthrobacter sp. JCM 19049]|uniref:glycosyltransferase family 87 protein n=1 Tax=Arthrobacter sp. JCM 19049 TaxID=1460643 RepID=UPI002436D5AD|nr:glycosyltransferase 87 family protein [Arthrobacter sp. JCM 19049]
MTASINWDMWAVALLALGMLSFARRHLVLAGVLIGLGTATKLYPVLFLGAVLVLALRTGKLRVFAVTGGSALAAWLSVNIPYALAFPESFAHFFKFTSERGAGLSSFWHVWNIVAAKVPDGAFGGPGHLPVGLVLFFLACVAVALLTFFARQRPRVASLVFLIVGSFVLVNKVYSPQFIVWLIPLFALALPRWKEFTVWMAVEVLHFYGLWFYIHSYSSEVETNHAFPESGYVVLVLAHMFMLGYLMFRVVQSILKPEYDPVRAVGQEDPQAGPFAAADDRISWSIVRSRRGSIPSEATTSAGGRS